MTMPRKSRVTVTFADGTRKEYEAGVSLLFVVREFQKNHPFPVLAAKVDNVVKRLTYQLVDDCRIEWLDTSTEDGHKIYCRSLASVLIRAARELYPDCRCTISYSINKGLYGELLGPCPVVDENHVKTIEDRMRQIIDADEPFVRMILTKEEALELYKKDGYYDKVNLLKYWPQETVGIYKLGWMHDYFGGHMAPSTGYLKHFRLQYYPPGFILQFPERTSPDRLPDPVSHPKLNEVFREAERWAQRLRVEDVGALNEYVANGRHEELIQIEEAFHEKKISHIADSITDSPQRCRLITIAGPSSSGKTTFSQRLLIQLRVNGVFPVTISLDDYFLDREHTPRDAEGNYDFESIDAIDLPLFNEHLSRLIDGEEVEVPTFNFKTGRREYTGRKIRVEKDQPLIIEGIHGLNERLTASIPREQKFKIYVSALTQLNLDLSNRIPTTDNRLLRRIVRDNRARNHSALRTLEMWESVRRGEDRNIFPYQEEADVMFNSALIYELPVLRYFAEPLLREIDRSHPVYSEAKRLLHFLNYFLPIENHSFIPKNSILREFIG